MGSTTGLENTPEETRELRVLHVLGSLGISGAEQWLIALLRHLRDTRHERMFDVRMDILLTSGEPGPLDEEAASLGARLHFIRYSRSNLPTFARAFRKLLRSGRYHVLHHHQDHSAGTHLILGTGLLPAVRAVHYHNPLASRAAASAGIVQQWVARAGAQVVKRRATHILGTSSHTLSAYGVDQASVPPRVQSRALHCGFDVSRFRASGARAREALLAGLGWPEPAKILLFVGRLFSHARHNQKNPHFAVEVAAACMRRNPTVRMLFAGGSADPTDQQDMDARIEDLGLADRFRILGQRSDIPELMSASDLLLFPSLAEGLGMVAVEAQAAGLPVLASAAVPAEVSVVPGGVHFLALEQGADVWADEALRILDLPRPDPDRCNDLVAQSPFAIENSARDLLEVYSSGHFR